MKRRLLVGILAVVVSVASGCGSGDPSGAPAQPERTYRVVQVRACLEQGGARVYASKPLFGDASRGGLQVRVRGASADVAFGADAAAAESTAREAAGMLQTFGIDPAGARHRGNVAYWQLDEATAPVDAIDRCLR